MPAQQPKNEGTDPSLTFYGALKELKSRYPMCYLEAWTPEDFCLDENNEAKDDIDWSERRWKRMASRLGHEFDASIGTNWDRVGEVFRRLAEKR